MKALPFLLRTDGAISTLLLRLTLGMVFFPHGMQKMFGWFGGSGFTGTMGFFERGLHVPAFFAFLAIMAEFAGSLGLIVGLFTRVAAFGIAVNMVVAIALVHAPNGFFMNWFGHQKGEGFEFHLLAIGLAIVIMIRGGGAASADSVLADTVAAQGQPASPYHQAS